MSPNKEQKPATRHTRELNQGFGDVLNLNNQESFQDAQRGFIKTLSPMAISREDGSKTYTLEDLEFLEGHCPDSVNPSLGPRPDHGLTLTLTLTLTVGH